VDDGAWRLIRVGRRSTAVCRDARGVRVDRYGWVTPPAGREMPR